MPCQQKSRVHFRHFPTPTLAALAACSGQVLVPIGLPDEGTFAWLDSFKEKAKFTELSGRSVKEWAMKSGLWPSGHGRTFNDQPTMDFGLKELDSGTTRQVIHAIAPCLHRNYIVMEVQKNLLAEDRRKALAAFNTQNFKRVAMVVMGEPPEEFKTEARENLLQARRDKVAAEVQRAKKRPSKWDNGSQANLSPEELEAEVKAKVDEVKLSDSEMQSWFQKQNDGDIPEKDLAKVFSDFSLPSVDEGFQEIQFIWQGEEDCSKHLKKWIAERKLTQRVEDLKPNDWFKKQAELWQQSMLKWKRKHEDWHDPMKKRLQHALLHGDAHGCADASPNSHVLATARRLEEEARRRRDEQPQEKDKPLPVGRLDEKVVDLESRQLIRQNGERGARVLSHSPLSELHSDHSADSKRSQGLLHEKSRLNMAEHRLTVIPGLKIKDADDPPKSQKLPGSCDDVDPWKLEDLTDIGTGEPLFSKFTWEDWMLLELRFQLHALVHGYKHVMNDPERVRALTAQKRSTSAFVGVAHTHTHTHLDIET